MTLSFDGLDGHNRRRRTPRPKLKKAVWSRLPPELVICVFKELDLLVSVKVDTKRTRRTCASLCQVCKEWSSSLRRLLFRKLALRSKTDVQTLIDLLKTPLSSPVRNFIQDLSFEEFDPRSPPLTHRLQILLSLTPALSHLTYRGLPIPSMGAFLGINRRQLHKSPSTLRNLVLDNVYFHSFSYLAVTLAQIRALKSIRLYSVRWRVLLGDYRATRWPECGLAKLQYLSADSCTQVWPFILLFLSPSSARHVQGRPEIISDDQALLIDVARTVASSSGEQCDGQIGRAHV